MGKNYRQRGFSLLEVILAMTILSVLALNTMQVMSQSSRRVLHNDDQMRASLAAERRLIELRNQYLQTGIVVNETVVPVPDLEDLQNARMDVAVSRHDGGALADPDGLRRIEVRVGWQDRTNSIRQNREVKSVEYVFKG